MVIDRRYRANAHPSSLRYNATSNAHNRKAKGRGKKNANAHNANNANNAINAINALQESVDGG